MPRTEWTCVDTGTRLGECRDFETAVLYKSIADARGCTPEEVWGVKSRG